MLSRPGVDFVGGEFVLVEQRPRAIARGGYVAARVFFGDESDAIAAGYRPCAVCLPKAYRRWKDGASQV